MLESFFIHVWEYIWVLVNQVILSQMFLDMDEETLQHLRMSVANEFIRGRNKIQAAKTRIFAIVMHHLVGKLYTLVEGRVGTGITLQRIRGCLVKIHLFKGRYYFTTLQRRIGEMYQKYYDFDMKHITPDIREADVILPMIHFFKQLRYNLEWYRGRVERRKEDR